MAPADATEEAIGALYERVGPMAFRLARAILGGAAGAEDVVQEAFLRLWRRRDALADREALDGYAVRAVRNLAYKRIRRRQVEGAAQDHLERTTPLVVLPHEPETAPPVDAALRALPPEQREVVHLRVYEGLAMTEIAARTGVPLGTVHSRYRYALGKLRAQLGGAL
jgi:RNA polymerase sigma-70 factor (ECF subfamily)